MCLTLGVANSRQDGCREDCISQKALLGEVPMSPSLKLELRCAREEGEQRSGDHHAAGGSVYGSVTVSKVHIRSDTITRSPLLQKTVRHRYKRGAVCSLPGGLRCTHCGKPLENHTTACHLANDGCRFI
ncbi:unnamed protein product [Pleuronectes platessa]|uniref:Uncharacterized protein n=1 Tax=Pleuronectes platessa TaxID=8262 RepID=A0A9N7U4I7_PLEPL|nr:unnamed protein product [Pleuronectes platessa]